MKSDYSQNECCNLSPPPQPNDNLYSSANLSMIHSEMNMALAEGQTSFPDWALMQWKKTREEDFRVDCNQRSAQPSQDLRRRSVISSGGHYLWFFAKQMIQPFRLALTKWWCEVRIKEKVTRTQLIGLLCYAGRQASSIGGFLLFGIR